MNIYLRHGESRVGPYKIELIKGWIKAGYVKMQDPAFYEGLDEWVKVKDLPGIEVVVSGHVVGENIIPPFEAYRGDEPYVFISYAHRDSKKVFEEINIFNKAGYHIWYDEGIEASNEWPEEIAKAVIGCAVFLVFISPRSTASVNCRNEINLALNEGKPFLAVYLEESALPPGLRLRMGDLQAILSYKLPLELYQKKVCDTLDQLLPGKQSNNKSQLISSKAITKKDSNVLQKPTPADKAIYKKVLGVVLSFFILVIGSWFVFSTGETSIDKKDTTLPPKEGNSTVSGTFAKANRDEKANAGVPIEGKFWTVPSIGMEMIWCEPGTFMMGSPDSELWRKKDREKLHQVTIERGFYLGKYELTTREYEKIMGAPHPGLETERDMPVYKLVHSGAILMNQGKRIHHPQAFGTVVRLNEIEFKAGRLHKGWKYGIPYDDQWEFACRAGTSTAYFWGNHINPDLANFIESGLKAPVKIGSYPPNPWGFYDMHGNVSEWCNVREQKGVRVIRGGDYKSNPGGIRSANKGKPFSKRTYGPGLRIIYQKID